MKGFYLTTAIDYANGSPHIGHAYEKVLADVVARLQRLEGRQVHFLTGLDEHGQKVQQSAEALKIAPMELCDRVASEFQNLCKVLSVSHDSFVRTTDPAHKEMVREKLSELYAKGDIYKGSYQGFYSMRQEQFLREKDWVEGKWPAVWGEVVEIEEAAYFFKLSQYQDWLGEFIRDHEDFIYPSFRRKQVLRFLEEPLNDLCISRPKERLEWGIPLPFDEDFVCYVWLDALSSYLYPLRGKCDFYPADVHIIGKDILVPSHGIYWPVMLHAMGLPLPTTLLVHGWWNVKGEKMSKSLNNRVDPFELVDTLGADALRYFFLREMKVGADSDFSRKQLLKRYHEDLGNDLGNLVSRWCTMVHRYQGGVLGEASVEEGLERSLREAAEVLLRSTRSCNADFQYSRSLELIFAFVAQLNRYVERRQPWVLAKGAEPRDRAVLESCLVHLAEGLRLVAVELRAFMPATARTLHDLLGVELPVEGVPPWGGGASDGQGGRESYSVPSHQSDGSSVDEC